MTGRKMEKGTIGVETIFVVAILLAMFAIVNLFIAATAAQVADTGKVWEIDTKCSRIAGILASVYSSGSGTLWKGSIDTNIAVYSDYISLWSPDSNDSGYCLHYADLNNADFSLKAGDIEIENVYGRVVIRNA